MLSSPARPPAITGSPACHTTFFLGSIEGEDEFALDSLTLELAFEELPSAIAAAERVFRSVPAPPPKCPLADKTWTPDDLGKCQWYSQGVRHNLSIEIRSHHPYRGFEVTLALSGTQYFSPP